MHEDQIQSMICNAEDKHAYEVEIRTLQALDSI